MKSTKVYATLFEAMVALANKKNQVMYHVAVTENGWYAVVKN